jgi:hypothetical protein
LFQILGIVSVQCDRGGGELELNNKTANNLRSSSSLFLLRLYIAILYHSEILEGADLSLLKNKMVK